MKMKETVIKQLLKTNSNEIWREILKWNEENILNEIMKKTNSEESERENNVILMKEIQKICNDNMKMKEIYDTSNENIMIWNINGKSMKYTVKKKKAINNKLKMKCDIIIMKWYENDVCNQISNINEEWRYESGFEAIILKYIGVWK